jgi:hypothetical protein
MEDGIKVNEYYGKDGGAETSIISPKFKEPFVIKRSGYTGTMFEVHTSGKKSSSINGLFTTMLDAKAVVLQHIRTSKPSKAVERDRKWEERHGSRPPKKPRSKSK